MRIEQWNNGALVSFVEVPESSASVKAELRAIDIDSIRSIREWIAAQPTAPQILKDREAAAVLARAKL